MNGVERIRSHQDVGPGPYRYADEDANLAGRASLNLLNSRGWIQQLVGPPSLISKLKLKIINCQQFKSWSSPTWSGIFDPIP